MASTRLPGKVLLPLYPGKTVISEVLERGKAIAGIDTVCCAIPDTHDCDALATAALEDGALVFRGSEKDVLDRYYRAAAELKADVVMRITSDCPLIDPELCTKVLDAFHLQDADIACNDLSHTWPVGLGCEAFSFRWLERAANEAVSAYDREHVSPYILNHPEARVVNLPSPTPGLAAHRWTLDTKTDYFFLTELFKHLPRDPKAWGHHFVLSIVEADSRLSGLSRSQHAS